MVVTALKKAARRGFTLVELVIVVLVIGIIAAIAAPKMFDTANNARTNGTQQSLKTLRNAIELHRAQNGAYPAAGALPTALAPFLSGPFPAVQVGANQNANVATASTAPITTPAGTEGWIYHAGSGEIRVNNATGIAW
jgi:general secretion pathway protein G